MKSSAYLVNVARAALVALCGRPTSSSTSACPAVIVGFEHGSRVVLAAAIIRASVFVAFVFGGSTAIAPTATELGVGIPDVSPQALARTVAANPRLRWVQIMAAGGASQVVAARLSPADLGRVMFTTSAGVHARTLAEFAVFGLLAGAKTLPRLLNQQRERVWSDRWAMSQVHEQTVLVVGLGAIGWETARLAAALGARVIGVNRSPVEVEGAVRVVGLDQLVDVAREADAIVVTLPGATGTDGLVDAEVLGALRRGATVVNVGRGTVIDEDALIAALRDGVVGFAALDVTAVEPLPAGSPLWSMPNVVISPHTAALSPAEDRRIAELAAGNARRLLDGEPLRNLVRVADLR